MLSGSRLTVLLFLLCSCTYQLNLKIPDNCQFVAEYSYSEYGTYISSSPVISRVLISHPYYYVTYMNGAIVVYGNLKSYESYQLSLVNGGKTYLCDSNSASIPYSPTLPYHVSWPNCTGHDVLTCTSSSDLGRHVILTMKLTLQKVAGFHDYLPMVLDAQALNQTSNIDIISYSIKYSDFVFDELDIDVFSLTTVCGTDSVKAYNPLTFIDAHLLIANRLRVMPYANEFSDYIVEFNKVYQSHDHLGRAVTAFHDNYRVILAHNSNPNKQYTMGINKFTDMSSEQFANTILSRVRRGPNYRNITNPYVSMHVPSGRTLPTAHDWVSLGHVTKVKDQGQCGSCWAFGSVGAIESVYSIEHGKLIYLSEQNLMDCSWEFRMTNGSDVNEVGNQGCNGGFASYSYYYFAKYNSPVPDSLSPYTQNNGFCSSAVHSSKVKVVGYKLIHENEEHVMDVLAFDNPISIAIDASQLQNYAGGIYSSPYCGTTYDSLDHEVLLVGYGTEMINGIEKKYWLIKNSWGHSWGEDGYFRMSREAHDLPSGMCGILLDATYPILA